MMTITTDNVRSFIESENNVDLNVSFDIAKLCVALLKDRQREAVGRDIVIRVLDNYKKFPESTYGLWNDIIEMSGLYPYVNAKILKGSGLLRYEYHKSESLIRDGEYLYLHQEQKEVSFQLKIGNSVVLSAPTSFGKSLLIEEIIANLKYENIVIIQPTLALLDETRKKLKRYSNYYNIILSTSQKPSQDKRNIFLFTGERAVEYSDFSSIDFFVIDEFYKLSLDRDDDRAITLNQAFYKLLKYTLKFYLLGPVIKSIPPEFQQKLNVGIHYTNFSTVSIDEFTVPLKKKLKEEDRKKELFNLLLRLNEPTLIYCSAPEKAVNLSNEFSVLKDFEFTNVVNNQDIVDWINVNINDKWSLSSSLMRGIAFHNGILPRHLGSSIVDAFNAGTIKFLFCTSTLIEGVNTTAKNIVLYDNTKGNKIPIDFFDYKNILGRSGRMNIYYTGRIFKFHNTPVEEKLDIDIPFITQTNAPAELLIHLDESELTDQSKEKLDQYSNVDPLLMNIIKTNNGMPIQGQLDLVKELEEYLPYYNGIIAWNNFPNYGQLLPVIDLAWRHLMKKKESKASVVSSKQLTLYTWQYIINKNLKKVINDQANSQYWLEKELDDNKRINKVTFVILNVARHWFDYKLPKWLSTVSKLQEYVFTKNGLNNGDYSVLAVSIENSFINTNLKVLLEYDIPISAINKLKHLFSSDESIESIFLKLRSLDLNTLSLNSYEIKKINQSF